jgi:hypothetical protein
VARGVELAATVSRGTVLYGKGFAIGSGRGLRLLLTSSRAIPSGRYTLTIKHRHKRLAQTITVR